MLKESLQGDFKTAMKSGDAFALGILRMVMSAMSNRSIEKRGKGLPEVLTDEEIVEVLAKESKKRLDAVALYVDGGREDLAEAERKEAAFIAKYLPAQMSADEIAAEVDAVIAGLPAGEAGAASKEFGAVMKEAMARMKGRADGKVVGDAIRAKLSA